MKIYTKTGDKGTTSLIGGKRVSKASLRLNCYGTSDELNSFIGLLRAKLEGEALQADATLLKIQNKLFNLGAYLATEPHNSEKTKNDNKKIRIEENDVLFLENEIDNLSTQSVEIHNFVLPAGSEQIALCHVCRTVCRRLERLMVELAENTDVEQAALKYVNRLSDFFFQLALFCTKCEKIVPNFWNL